MTDDDIVVPITDINALPNEPQYDLIIFNSKGEYFHCVGENNKNKTIKDFVVAVKSGNDISPSFLAQKLHKGLVSKDYDEAIIKLVIAINLHYHMALMLLEE